MTININTLPTGTITLTLDFQVREKSNPDGSRYDWVATPVGLSNDYIPEIESDQYFETIQAAVNNATNVFTEAGA